MFGIPLNPPRYSAPSIFNYGRNPYNGLQSNPNPTTPKSDPHHMNNPTKPQISESQLIEKYPVTIANDFVVVKIIKEWLLRKFT